jgi:hypothetical protein
MILDRIISVFAHINSVLTVFDSVQEGELVAQNGHSVVEIVTKKPPLEVWVSMKSFGNLPVCHGDISKVGYTITPTGFILYLDVAENSLEVGWSAIFDDK